jgi:hypothetical protein
MPISGYLIFIVMPFTRVSPGIPIIMDHRMADSKNYSSEMKSAFSAGEGTLKTLHSSRKVREKRAEKNPRHVIPPYQ